MKPDKNKITILLADDDPLVREMIAMILQEEGYVLETAVNGSDALKKFGSGDVIGLIVSDMNMPEIDGLGLIKAVREMGSDVPIIILTGSSDLTTANQALKIGANAYVLKDEHIQDTIGISVEKALEKHLFMKQNRQSLDEAERSNDKSETVQEKLKELQKSFSEQLPGKIREIEDALNRLHQDNCDPNRAETLARLLHTLAGTAGTFGFSDILVAAKSMEAELWTAKKTGMAPVCDEHFAALKGSCSAAAATPAVLSPQIMVNVSSASEPNTDEIFLVDDDPAVTESLALQLRCYGYRPSTFSTVIALKNALKTSTPRVIIMDLAFPEGRVAGADTIREIQSSRGTPIPVVFLSGRSDFNGRLEAVRSGGDAYFVKPVDVGRLVDRLDVMTARKPLAPFRILIVDDEPLLADYHATVMSQAGMTTTVVTKPEQVMEVLIDFRPELILMDVYMPGCSGMELAKLIRQDETYIDIPIVYLSSETDIDRQLAAMSRGGDDFLTKPIHPSHLITSVTLRADRYRMLRSFMLFDGLTGLLNHTKTKEQLDIEVSRALRQKTELSFAMIDLDHFKAVNDTYGHPVGDQILKSLSRLLKQRLRTTDIVGRYGGEEFAVILSDTDGQTACIILNELREDFSKICHTLREGFFNVTFSCGIASLEPGMIGTALIREADNALYAAKRAGRNCVVYGNSAEPS